MPRFLRFFTPNVHITESIVAGLRLLIPRIIADSLDWLHFIWRKRCSLVHGRSGTDSQTATANSTPHSLSKVDALSSQGRQARQNRRWSRRSTPTNTKVTATFTDTMSSTQQCLDSILNRNNLIIQLQHDSHSPQPTPVLDTLEDASEWESWATSPEQDSASSPANLLPIYVQNDNSLNTAQVPSLTIQPASRRITRSINDLLDWNFRDRRDDLDRNLSNKFALPIASRCALLPGYFARVPPTSYYFLPYQHTGYLGQSRIVGSGLGLFLETAGTTSMREGTVVGEFWGPSSANNGIDPSYLTSGLDPHGRDDGAYLLQHENIYIVDAHKNCAVGYLNDPFEDANCFFQANPENPCQILVVSRIIFPSRGVFELTVNYGWDYWKDRLHLLSSTAQARCLAFYQPQLLGRMP